jgi:hypothetical protein
MNVHNCRICGLYFDHFPWGENGDCPTYEICPCCNVEFGYEDYSLESIRKYRSNWLKSGANWFDKKRKPDEWNLEEQLENIPKDFL